MPRLFLIFLIACSGALAGQEARHGQLTGQVTWRGEILLDGDITVARNARLVIEPGTVVNMRSRMDRLRSGQHAERIEIIVLGELFINGTADAPVRFTSGNILPKPNDWYGIIIKNRSRPSILKHAIIEYAYKGITCYGSAPRIDDSQIQLCHYTGISCEVRSRAQIRDCRLQYNNFAGLLCELGAAPLVEGCEISHNGFGVLAFDLSTPDLGHAKADSFQSAGNNTFFANGEADIYNRSAHPIFAQRNNWNSGRIADIDDRILDGKDAQFAMYGEVQLMPLSATALSASSPPPQRVALSPAPAVQDSAFGDDAGVIMPVSRLTASYVDSVARPPTFSLLNLKPKPADMSQLPKPDTLAQETPPTGDLAVRSANFAEIRLKDSPTAAEAPVLEAFLDNGERRYRVRAFPKYPEIYRRTGHEGVVLMEVIVGLNGAAESYRILRSDGPYFTAAADEAIRKMRYQPETFQNQPARFKIFESFVFKLRE